MLLSGNVFKGSPIHSLLYRMITTYCYSSKSPSKYFNRELKTLVSFSISQGQANSAKLLLPCRVSNHKLISVIYTWLTRNPILHLKHQLHVLFKIQVIWQPLECHLYSKALMNCHSWVWGLFLPRYSACSGKSKSFASYTWNASFDFCACISSSFL